MKFSLLCFILKALGLLFVSSHCQTCWVSTHELSTSSVFISAWLLQFSFCLQYCPGVTNSFLKVPPHVFSQQHCLTSWISLPHHLLSPRFPWRCQSSFPLLILLLFPCLSHWVFTFTPSEYKSSTKFSLWLSFLSYFNPHPCSYSTITAKYKF